MLFSQTLSEFAPYTRASVRRRRRNLTAAVVNQAISDSNVQSLESRQMLSVSVGSDGYTDVVKSGDSKVIYVSSSGGSDSNSGLSSSSPVRTVAKAISMTRNGMPDEVLLKRGDSWRENLSWYKSGRSSQEPMLLGAYGSGNRPTIDAGGGTGIDISSGTVSNIVIQGIHFYSGSRNPDGGHYSRSSGGYGVRFVASTSNALIEDCQIDFFKFNLLTMPYGGGSQSNIKLRRNIVTDSYSLGDKGSGIYAQGVNNLTLEENVFDHNGWNEKVSGGGANIYSHNAYISEKNNNVVVKGNVFANASSHGLQMRAGGQVVDNLFLKNPIGLTYGLVNGDNLKAGGVTGNITGNVFTQTRPIGTSGRGWAIELGNIKSGTVADNIITDDSSASFPAITLGAGDAYNTGSGVGINNLTIEDNVVNKWYMSLEVSGEMRIGGSGNASINNLVVKNNDFQNTDNPYDRLIQHSAGTNTGDEYWSNNRYYDGGSNSKWFLTGSSVVSLSTWQSRIEGSAKNAKVAYNNPYASIDGYAGSLSSFLGNARHTTQGAYNSKYTARGAVNYFRGAFNKSATTSPTPSPTPTESETSPYGVSRLVLVNTDTNQDIATLGADTTVNLGSTPASHVAVRADVYGSATSVKFGLDGNTNYRVESYAPFALSGDTNGDLAPSKLSAGKHTITATAYPQLSAGGTASTPLVASVTLVEGGTTSVSTDTTRPYVKYKGTSSQWLWATFSENVSASLSASDLVVKNTGTGATVSGLSFKIDGNGAGVWWWPNYNGGTLPHGTYKATLAAGNVKDAAGNTMASDWSTTFSV